MANLPMVMFTDRITGQYHVRSYVALVIDHGKLTIIWPDGTPEVFTGVTKLRSL